MEFGESPFCPVLPEGVSFAQVRIGDGQAKAVELELLSPNAAERRREALSAGREALRRAVVSVSPDFDLPILRGDGGQPLLPQGILGSISHSAEWSVAAATVRDDFLGLGVDLQVVESRNILKIGKRISSASELEWIGRDTEKVLTLFSIKEAIYKALYPTVGRYFGFREVEVFPDSGDEYLVEPCAADLERAVSGARIMARSERFSNYLLSGVYICRG